MTDGWSEDRPYYWGNPEGGRRDEDGLEWFKTDGYGGWYRRENGKIITKSKPRFPDEPCRVCLRGDCKGGCI